MQAATKESDRAGPGVAGVFVGRPAWLQLGRGHEAVAHALIELKLEVVPVLPHRFGEALHVVHPGAFVLVAPEPDDRPSDPGNQVDRSRAELVLGEVDRPARKAVEADGAEMLSL